MLEPSKRLCDRGKRVQCMVENSVTEKTIKRGNKNTHRDTAFSEAEFFFCPLMSDRFSGSLLMPPACFSSPVPMERGRTSDGCLQGWSFKKQRLSKEFFRISLRDLYQMSFRVQKEENAHAQKHPCEVQEAARARQ